MSEPGHLDGDVDGDGDGDGDGAAAESHGQYISAIYRHMQVVIAAELAPYRIGSGQYIFLMAIASGRAVTQKALSARLLVDKATTAKAIAKLEAEGYVRREPAPADNRYQLLQLTDAGRQVVPKVKEALARVKARTRRGLPDEAYNAFIQSLKLVLRNLTEPEEIRE